MSKRTMQSTRAEQQNPRAIESEKISHASFGRSYKPQSDTHSSYYYCTSAQQNESSHTSFAAMASSGCAFIDFVSRNRYIIRGQDHATPLTHLLMDGEKGGKLSIPTEATDGFFAAYAQDLNAGTPLFVVEKRTPVFKFCLDVDFKKVYPTADIRRFVDATCHEVAKYFTPKPEVIPKEAHCIVCAVTDEDNNRKAPGLHLIFPFAPVQEDAAKWIRAGVVHNLHDLDGFDENWNTVIDISIITTSGLRMVGSDKCRTCTACKNIKDNRQCCCVCNRRGKTAENKIYWPWEVFPSDHPDMIKCLENMKQNKGHAARICSIRLGSDVSQAGTFRVPPFAPGMGTKRKRAGKSTGDDPDKQFTLEDDSPEFPRAKTGKVLNLSPQAMTLLTEAIRNFHSAYSNIKVKDVTEIKQTKGSSVPTLWIRVCGYGSRFCLNKGLDHTSQNIYFTASPTTGLAQKCFSRKDIQRQCGKCESFTSTYKPLGSKLRALLFPGVAADKSRNGVARRFPGAVESNATKRLQESALVSSEILSMIPRKAVMPQSQ